MIEEHNSYYRPNWDDYFMAITRIVATRSTCDRLRAGAVLVKDNRIISTGYNGSPSGQSHCDGPAGHLMEEGHCVRTIHAEHNAILQAAIVPGMSTEGATLYAKYSFCIHCTKYVIAAKIKRVVVAKVYRNYQVTDILKQAGIQVDIYQENPEWDAVVRQLFENGIEEKIAKEGDIKLEGFNTPLATL